MNKLHLSIALALALALAACDKSPAEGAKAEAPSAAAPAEGPQTPAQSALASYERARALLARDATAGLADAADEIARQATLAASDASAALKPHLEAMAKAAADLKAQAGDLEKAREAFGEVSRHVVALLAADPALAKGRHVFECGMAKGYQKWVQTKEGIENPYMGSKMLACGSESSWK